jgi:hypothetical protein
VAQASKTITTTDGLDVIPAAPQFTPIEAAHVDNLASMMATNQRAIARGRADPVDFAESSERMPRALTAVLVCAPARSQRRGSRP